MTKAERIKKARIDANITQEELATYCGTTKQAIYKYEQGIVTNIPTDKIELLAECLHVSPEYLMGWTKEETDDVESGTILGKAAQDPNQIHLLETYQNLDADNQGKLIQFADALALLPNSGATPL